MNFIKENDRIENPLARQQSHEASREAHHEFRAHVGRSHYERNQQDDDEEKGDSSVLALTSEGDMGDLSGSGGFKKKKVENPYDFSPTHKDFSQITKPVKQSKGNKQRRGIMGESKKQESVPRFDKKGRTVDDGRSTSKLQSLLSSEWDSFDLANPQSRQDKSSSSQKQQKKNKKRSEGLSSSPKKQDKKKKKHTSKSSKSPRKRSSPSSSSSSKSSKSEEKKKETKEDSQSSKKSSSQQQSKKEGRGILRQESDFKQDHTHESLVRMKSSEGKTWEL